MIAYTIVASPYVKITPRIEPRPLNPSCNIGTTMIEDSAISTTYNLRLLFNPSYTVPTIDPTLTGTICRRCDTCPLQTSPLTYVPNSIGSLCIKLLTTITCYQGGV